MQRMEQIKNEKDPFKKARMIGEKVSKEEVKIKDIAQELGKTSSYVCHLLRLLRLPEIIIDGYYSHTVSLSHLFIISRLKQQKEAIKAYEQTLINTFTIQQLEIYVREKLYHVKTIGEKVDAGTLQNIEKKFSSIDSDIRVSVAQTRISASVNIRVSGNTQKTSEILRHIANRF